MQTHSLSMIHMPGERDPDAYNLFAGNFRRMREVRDTPRNSSSDGVRLHHHADFVLR
jgi:hypothetical protein